MLITLNGEPREVAAALPVADLLRDLLGRLPERGYAVAVNDQVLPSTGWTTHQLAPDDRVEVVGFVGGG